MHLPESWRQIGPLANPAGWAELVAFLKAERASEQVFPPEADVLKALELTEFDAVRVVMLGQDPYHNDGQAHGLAFSVLQGKAPPSLCNIFKELASDLGLRRNNTNLSDWAKQGVLLLNTVLTVRAHQPASHKGKGWESVTDAIIRALNASDRRLVFVLWGAQAQKKLGLIDTKRHAVIASAHPSPLSAHNGFFGSKPFSKINAALLGFGHESIKWDA